jgi:hypothetical protein
MYIYFLTAAFTSFAKRSDNFVTLSTAPSGIRISIPAFLQAFGIPEIILLSQFIRVLISPSSLIISVLAAVIFAFTHTSAHHRGASIFCIVFESVSLPVASTASQRSIFVYFPSSVDLSVFAASFFSFSFLSSHSLF